MPAIAINADDTNTVDARPPLVHGIQTGPKREIPRRVRSRVTRFSPTLSLTLISIKTQIERNLPTRASAIDFHQQRFTVDRMRSSGAKASKRRNFVSLQMPDLMPT